MKINSNITLLQVSGIWSGQGYTEKYKRWYYNGKEILYYVTHADNKGVTDNKAEIFEFNTKISVDENNSQLILYKFGTTKDENTSKIVTINQTSIYKFIDNRFERIVSKMK